MRSNEIEAYKSGLKLSDFQREVLIGKLLGDGHLETQNGGRTYLFADRALIINTQSFSKLEVIRLAEILKEKYGIETALRKQSRKQIELYQLITKKGSAEKFVPIVVPYIVPSMRYKLGILGNIIA